MLFVTVCPTWLICMLSKSAYALWKETSPPRGQRSCRQTRCGGSCVQFGGFDGYSSRNSEGWLEDPLRRARKEIPDIALARRHQTGWNSRPRSSRTLSRDLGHETSYEAGTDVLLYCLNNKLRPRHASLQEEKSSYASNTCLLQQVKEKAEERIERHHRQSERKKTTKVEEFTSRGAQKNGTYQDCDVVLERDLPQQPAQADHQCVACARDKHDARMRNCTRFLDISWLGLYPVSQLLHSDNSRVT